MMRLSHRTRLLYLTEGLFLLSLLSIVFILWTGGFKFEGWGIPWRFFSLKNPFLFLFAFLGLHLLVAGRDGFVLCRKAADGLEWLSQRIHQPLARVHWALKLAVLLLLAAATVELWRSPFPGLRREMTSRQGEKVLEKVYEDRQINFRPPTLRRDFYRADRMEVRWRGHLFTPPEARVYRFAVEGDGFHTLKLHDVEVLQGAPDWQVVRTEGEFYLEHGAHPFELRYGDIGYQSTVRLLWEPVPGRWEPVPDYCFTRDSVDYDDHRALLRRAQFRPLALLACLFWVWHFLLLGVERWKGFSPEEKAKWNRRLLILMLLVAFAFRWYFVVESKAMTHADEAMVALMAQHVAEGRELPLMYYDQVYNGTALAYILAPLYYLFGPSLWHLKSVTCLLSVLLVYLVYRVTRRWLGAGAALIAAFLTAVAPVMCVVYGLMALVGPIEGVVIAFVVLWLAQPMLMGERASAGRWFLLGLVAGLGVWVNFQIFYYLLPVGVFLLLRAGALVRRLPALALGGLLGISPLLAYNVPRGFPTLARFVGRTVEKDLGEIVGNQLIRIGLPHILGSRVRWDMFHSFTPEPLPQLVGILFGLALLGLLLLVVRGLWEAGRWQRLRGSPEAFILGFFLSVLFLYMRSDFGEYYPRYLFSIFPMVSVLFGWWIARRLKARPALAALVFLPLAAQNVVGNAKVDPFYFSQPVHYVDAGTFIPKQHRRLLAYLEQSGLTRLHCDYWIAYVLALESGERVIGDSDRDRCPGYREAFLAASRPAYLFHNHDGRILFYRELFGRRLEYELAEFLPWVVYAPREAFVPRAQWKVTASQDEETAPLAADGDMTFASHWRTWISSGEASLEIDLGEVREVDRVLVVRGWPQKEDASGQGLVRGQLWLSEDGHQWQLQAPGGKDATGHLDPFTFPRQNARYLRIVNRPEEFPYLWTVYDVFVQ